MPAGRPPIDLNQKIRDILQHTCEVDSRDDSPIGNFELRANSSLNLIRYLDNRIQQQPFYQAVYDRHMGLLQLRVLGSLIENFERFIKEVAIVCVDSIAPYTFDDRFEKFTVSTGSLVSQFSAGSIGRALCESDAWLSNKSISDKFRQFLKPHFGDPVQDFLFPNRTQKPSDERDRAETLAILWQIRHNITHNTGLLTASDAKKLTLLLKSRVDSGSTICPDLNDLRYVKQFLDETANKTNDRIAVRLAALLTELHSDDPLLFDPQAKVDEVSRVFQQVLVVSEKTGVL